MVGDMWKIILMESMIALCILCFTVKFLFYCSSIIYYIVIPVICNFAFFCNGLLLYDNILMC